MHDDLDAGIGHELGDRAERRPVDRVDQVDPARRGHLGQARDRRVGALPEELEVDGRPPLGAGLLHDGIDAGGVA